MECVVDPEANQDRPCRDDHRREHDVQDHGGAECDCEAHHDREPANYDDLGVPMEDQHRQGHQEEAHRQHGVHQLEVDCIGDVVQHRGQAGDGYRLPLRDDVEAFPVHGRYRVLVCPAANLALGLDIILVEETLGVGDECLVVPDILPCLIVDPREDVRVCHVEGDSHDYDAGVPSPVAVGVPNEVRHQLAGVLHVLVDPLLGSVALGDGIPHVRVERR